MYATEAEFNMNNVIFEQGWQSDAVYLLQKGDVELYAGGVNELQTGPCVSCAYFVRMHVCFAFHARLTITDVWLLQPI
jgi:hypothetical protein